MSNNISYEGKRLQESHYKRHSGIDFLKIVAMLMICILHVNVWSNGLSVSHASSTSFPPRWWWSVQITQTVSIIAVNLYAMATGYLCIKSCWRLSRYLELWIQVAFYSLLGLAVGFLLIHYSIIDLNYLHSVQVCHLLFPIPLANGYWYFSAYTALFFISPLINRIVLAEKKRTLISLLTCILVVLPILNQGNRTVYVNLGYNFTWLLVLYIAGAYLRVYPIQFRLRYISLAWMIVFGVHMVSISIAPGFQVFYTSLPVTIASFLFFAAFTKIRFSGWLARLSELGALTSFGVYLLQLHPYFWSYMDMRMPEWCVCTGYPIWLLPAIAMAMYIVLSCLDALRLSLFKLLRVKEACIRLDSVITRQWKCVMSLLQQKL